jgi:hypothetical protein
MLKKKKNKSAGAPLPPRTPEAIVELDRAIMLLGNLMNSDLKQKRRQELVKLLGRYPSASEASVWKSALKGLREELLEFDG